MHLKKNQECFLVKEGLLFCYLSKSFENITLVLKSFKKQMHKQKLFEKFGLAHYFCSSFSNC